MKQISDLRLLGTVIAVPVVLALGMAIGNWGFGETFGSDTVAICMMMILMFSALSVQSLCKKALDTGPRAVARYLGFALGMFAIVIIGQVPPADMALGQMLQGWLWFPAILLFGLSLAAIRPLRAMGRHPRGLWILARRGAVALAVAVALAAFFAWMETASLAQAVWGGFVLLAVLSSGGVTFGAYRGQRKTGLGKLARAMAEAVPFAAMITLTHYTAHFGQVEDIGIVPFGTVVGAGIVFLVVYFGEIDAKAGT